MIHDVMAPKERLAKGGGAVSAKGTIDNHDIHKGSADRESIGSILSHYLSDFLRSPTLDATELVRWAPRR